MIKGISMVLKSFSFMVRAAFFVGLIVMGYSGISQVPIDKNATRKTKNLLENLHIVSETGFMFGHEDALAYGIGWKGEKGRSDVKETVGSYPAVHGWDLGHLGKSYNIDSAYFKQMVQWIRDSYKRGGITTISWHLDNPLTGGNTWDTTPAVKEILPGGTKHEEFKERLDLMAIFFNECRSGLFTKIPIIFRPWHEHNGDWFWWGKGFATEEEYVALWKFTVEYLRDEKEIHHLLYAFSPDRSRMDLENSAEANYLYAYPGDDYVDIIGLDNYWDVGHSANKKTAEEQKSDYNKALRLVTKIAREKGKVAALTETGMESIPNPEWFTDVILSPIKNSSGEIKIAWVLVWRNANTKHHYAPYPGHPSEPDFKAFFSDESTYFESDLRNPYKKRRALRN